MDGETGRQRRVGTRRRSQARGAAPVSPGAGEETTGGACLPGGGVDDTEAARPEPSARFPTAGAALPADTDREHGAGNHLWRRARNGEGVVLDEISKRIIEELQVDGRRSYSALARTIGLSEAAVRQRVQHLLRAGVMQIVAVTDPLTLGFTRQALIAVRVEGDVRAVAAALVAAPEIDYVVMCAGAYDVLAEVVCEDDDHLLVILNETIRAIPGVRDTETFVYLRLAKQTYTWGTR